MSFFGIQYSTIFYNDGMWIEQTSLLGIDDVDFLVQALDAYVRIARRGPISYLPFARPDKHCGG